MMNEKERNTSIEYILSQGLVKPQMARARIAEMINIIGFRYIFWDTGYSLFFAGATIVLVFLLFVLSPTHYRYSTTVAVAPLMFLLTMVFAETSERACGLYELKQTCRYTIRQITALRVVCYSIVGVVITTVIAIMGAKDWYEFLSIFPLCLSALFICATLSLTIMRFLPGKWGNAFYLSAWIFVSIALPFSHGEKWEAALCGMPILLSVMIAVAGATVFVYQISRMLSEVDKYAVA